MIRSVTTPTVSHPYASSSHKCGTNHSDAGLEPTVNHSTFINTNLIDTNYGRSLKIAFAPIRAMCSPNYAIVQQYPHFFLSFAQPILGAYAHFALMLGLFLFYRNMLMKSIFVRINYPINPNLVWV